MIHSSNSGQEFDQDIGALARRYEPILKRFFRRRVVEGADVDDLVQDVFLRLTRRGELTDVANLEGYIFQIAANILRDRLRQQVTHRFKDHEPIQDDQIEEAVLSPERVLQGKEALERLKGALLELPERTRSVFFLCRIEGIPHADVGTRMGLSLSAVNKHMAKAMEFLMERMKGEF